MVTSKIEIVPTTLPAWDLQIWRQNVKRQPQDGDGVRGVASRNSMKDAAKVGVLCDPLRGQKVIWEPKGGCPTVP